MVNINERLTKNEKAFFDGLSIYIDKPIYFYGSITRMDYIPGKSDIDIDIFTENESSTINKLSNYLKLDKKSFRKSLNRINNQIVRGYKAKYSDEVNNIEAEISIINEKYKNAVIGDHEFVNNLPFYVLILIYILKILYYNLNIITEKTYKMLKNYLMRNGELNFMLIY